MKFFDVFVKKTKNKPPNDQNQNNNDCDVFALPQTQTPNVPNSTSSVIIY
jgi:hypothetical protein